MARAGTGVGGVFRPFLQIAPPKKIMDNCGRALGPARTAAKAFHLDEAVLAVPGVGKAPIISKVPVRVVTEYLRGLWDEHVSLVACDQIRIRPSLQNRRLVRESHTAPVLLLSA